MKNFLPAKEKHKKNFATIMFNEMMQKRYGVQTCKPEADALLVSLRNQILQWQEKEDFGALLSTSINFRGWLAIYFDENDEAQVGGTNDPETFIPGQFNSFNVAYPYGDSSQNIIEVNTGGCYTRINLNPSITINNSTKYQHFQDTPSATWVIVHNLGFTPNAFTVDTHGIEIEGVVEPVDENTLNIVFSQPVSGYAYLS